MNKGDLFELVTKKHQILGEKIIEYFELWFNTSVLDGEFTSEQLRMIADAMDELTKIAKDNNLEF